MSTKEPNQRVALGTAIRRGVRLRCPNCGVGHLHNDENDRFKLAPHLLPECGSCGMPFAAREGDLWFFYYMSNAALTGVWLIVVTLLFRTKVLDYPGTWKIWALLSLSLLVALMATLRFRRGFAIAIDYCVDALS